MCVTFDTMGGIFGKTKKRAKKAKNQAYQEINSPSSNFQPSTQVNAPSFPTGTIREITTNTIAVHNNDTSSESDDDTQQMLPSVPPTPPIQTFRQYKTQSIRGPLGLMLQADNTDRVPTTADTPHISILIKKGTKLFIPEESHIPMYRTNGNVRGKSLIINNIKFKHKHPRDGAHNDSTNMFNLLKALDLNPKEKDNLTTSQISKTLQHFSNNSELDKVDICFIVIMSYGKGSVNDMTEIYGVDEGLIKVHDIISHFASNRCKKLAGKPKVFIFQCSRDSADNKGIEFDARPPTPPPHLGDMLIAYSTMPGFPSGRNLELGSYYIREICNVFMRHACDLHLEDMFKIIENNLKNRTIQQHTSYENKSFQNCYLNPK